ENDTKANDESVSGETPAPENDTKANDESVSGETPISDKPPQDTPN
ncbi:MAG: hypothetical protein HOB58_05220, partial [Nitrospina sp.]|nr:hypothetical protein [Nitrospina sp.]